MPPSDNPVTVLVFKSHYYLEDRFMPADIDATVKNVQAKFVKSKKSYTSLKKDIQKALKEARKNAPERRQELEDLDDGVMGVIRAITDAQ